MYGGFWLSFGAIYWPGSGILEAYSGEAASQLPSALGIYVSRNERRRGTRLTRLYS
jgi:succinate-acetate transporter protein